MIPDRQIPTKAFVVDAPGASFVLPDVVLDEVRPHEVLVEMSTGLCHTVCTPSLWVYDSTISLWDTLFIDIVVQQGAIPIGEYPAVLGPEGAGMVRRVGSSVKDKNLAEGDQVFLSFTTCDSCHSCEEGHLGFCRQFMPLNFAGVRGISAADSPISTKDGKPIRGQFFGQSSMGKLAIVSETSIVKSPAGLKITDADMGPLSPLGCGYLTGAGTIFNVLKSRPSDSLVVLGMGAVGLSALLAARAQGVKNVVAVDLVDAKLELATSLGASHTLNTTQVPDLAHGLREMFPNGVDHVVDTTGVAPLLESSVKALGHAGTLVIVGVARAGSVVNIGPLDLMVNCKRIIGAIEGSSNPAVLLPQLLDLYKQGNFPIDKLAKVYDINSLDQALEDLHSGKVIKPVIKWMDL
ncbi:Polyketide synthase enoylreductase [Penicillium capsulatum]|nr:Polyketide synthase enoylreductase [Penicillium capsulatum]